MALREDLDHMITLRSRSQPSERIAKWGLLQRPGPFLFVLRAEDCSLVCGSKRAVQGPCTFSSHTWLSLHLFVPLLQFILHFNYWIWLVLFLCCLDQKHSGSYWLSFYNKLRRTAALEENISKGWLLRKTKLLCDIVKNWDSHSRILE